MTTPPPADDAPDGPTPAEPSFSAPASSWPPPGTPAGMGSPPPKPPGSPSDAAFAPWPASLVPRTNRLAIVALITGLAGMVLLAVGFAIAALVQIGRRGERGKGLAVGGLVASAVWTVVAMVILATVMGSLVTADRDDSGNITESDKVLLAALRVGDCFTGFRRERTTVLVTALPCTRPHDGETVAELRLPDGAYPGDEEVFERATMGCELRTVELQKSRYARDLEPYTVPPTRLTWEDGDRQVICLLRYTGPGTLTSPLAETLDPRRRLWPELAPGDCLGKWEESLAQRTVSCTEPHWMQVYAIFALKAGPYPGAKVTERKAEVGCEARLRKVFGKHPTPETISWAYPERYDWEAGTRTVVCFGESTGRPLKKSMLPR